MNLELEGESGGQLPAGYGIHLTFAPHFQGSVQLTPAAHPSRQRRLQSVLQSCRPCCGHSNLKSRSRLPESFLNDFFHLINTQLFQPSYSVCISLQVFRMRSFMRGGSIILTLFPKERITPYQNVSCSGTEKQNSKSLFSNS